MRRAIYAVSMATVLMLAGAATASAQPMGFGVGYLDVGPVVGLGGIGGASVSIGGRFEYGFKALPDLGIGVLSFAASFDHYAFDEGNLCGGFGNCTFSESFTPIGATINYHFRLDNHQLDPFFGVGLGDLIASSSCSSSVSSICNGSTFSASSGIYFIGRVGIRYFFTPKLAAYADAGSGQGAVHVGIMIKLKGE
jgi:hypothetical protein